MMPSHTNTTTNNHRPNSQPSKSFMAPPQPMGPNQFQPSYGIGNPHSNVQPLNQFMPPLSQHPGNSALPAQPSPSFPQPPNILKAPSSNASLPQPPLSSGFKPSPTPPLPTYSMPHNQPGGGSFQPVRTTPSFSPSFNGSTSTSHNGQNPAMKTVPSTRNMTPPMGNNNAPPTDLLSGLSISRPSQVHSTDNNSNSHSLSNGANNASSGIPSISNSGPFASNSFSAPVRPPVSSNPPTMPFRPPASGPTFNGHSSNTIGTNSAPAMPRPPTSIGVMRPPAFGSAPPVRPPSAGSFLPPGGNMPPPPPGKFMPPSLGNNMAPPPPGKFMPPSFNNMAPPQPPTSFNNMAPPPPSSLGNNMAPPPPGKFMPPSFNNMAPPQPTSFNNMAPPPPSNIPLLPPSSINNQHAPPPPVSQSKYLPPSSNGVQGYNNKQPYPHGKPNTSLGYQPRPSHQAPNMPYNSRSSVVSDGWNKGWGTENIDLLQYRNVLPSDGVKPPRPVLIQDFLQNCSPDVFRCTLNKIPETKGILNKAKVPFGILVHPFKDLDQLPVVSCQQIVRCKHCRNYINPFVVFRGERRWECNLCFRVNELPDEFLFDPVSQTYGDPTRRPEVKSATIEYIAPVEYMVRPPQPAVYLWLFDTSRQAVDTGYLKVVCDTLIDNIEDIPGDKRALIGFMSYSATVQFYLMPEDSDVVEQLEVGELEDMFLPHPDALLANLYDKREQIVDLLTNLPLTHTDSMHTQSSLGAALVAAEKLIQKTGGRITVFSATLPTIGPGALKHREDPNQRAAADVQHVTPATDFYKKLALDCSGQQIAVDLFTLNSQYIDLATLAGVSQHSAGSLHHFPNFHATMNPQSVEPLVSCLTRYITRKIGFEAVMRIRATQGLSISNFHGHFFVRSPDLLSLPNVNPDAGFAMQISLDEPLHNLRQATFQSAILYTSSRGERRIRVHTLCIPITGNVHDVINSVDQQACIALLSRMAVDKCMNSSSTDARDALVNSAIDALTSYRNTLNTNCGRALLASHLLKLWPLYTHALLKSTPFRAGLSTKLDDRVYAMLEIKTLPVKALIQTIYPDLYAVHQLDEQGALTSDDEEVIPQPPLIQLSAEYLARDGVYLADAGSKMVMYLRCSVGQNWLEDVFECRDFNNLPQIQYRLPSYDNSTSRLLNNFVSHLNSKKPYAVPMVIVREDGAARLQFTQLLVEDRSEGSKSYVEFIQFIAGSVK